MMLLPPLERRKGNGQDEKALFYEMRKVAFFLPHANIMYCEVMPAITRLKKW